MNVVDSNIAIELKLYSHLQTIFLEIEVCFVLKIDYYFDDENYAHWDGFCCQIVWQYVIIPNVQWLYKLYGWCTSVMCLRASVSECPLPEVDTIKL